MSDMENAEAILIELILLVGICYWAYRWRHWLFAVRRIPPARPPIPPHIRQMVFGRDGFRCRWCGSPHELQVDHIYPYSRGGSSDLPNLQCLCRSCNMLKGATVMQQPQVAPWISGEQIVA